MRILIFVIGESLRLYQSETLVYTFCSFTIDLLPLIFINMINYVSHLLKMVNHNLLFEINCILFLSMLLSIIIYHLYR